MPEVLAAADLPDPLGAIVRETVRRTRLRRPERIDIARELVAHFEAGLEAGADAARLAREFGEPRTAAPLLRSAARRRRGPIDRAFGHTLRWGGVAAAVLVVAYGAAAIRLTTMEPTVGFDAVARLQQLVPPATAGEAAWPRYREAMTWHCDRTRVDPAVRPPAEASTSIDRRRPVRAVASVPVDPAFDAILAESPDPEARRRDAAALRAHADELDRLRVAASMPALGWTHELGLSEADRAWFGDQPAAVPDFPEDALVNVRIPYVAVLRDAARLLAADARLALEAGDEDRAVASLEAIVGVAGHVGETPLVINQIVESELLTLSAEEILRAVLGDDPPPPRSAGPASIGGAGLDRLARTLRAIPADAWVLDLAGERLWFDDVVQRLYSDDGHGDGVLLADALGEARMTAIMSPRGDLDFEPPPALVAASAPVVAALAAGRRDTLALGHRLYDLLEAEVRLPILERPRQADGEIAELLRRPGLMLRHPIVRVVVPALSRAADQRTTARMAIEAAMTAIALEQWRREHGTWPDALATLVPDRLPRVPRDAWTGEPLRYAVTPDGPRLWAVGPDGDDDGGQPLVHAATGRARDREGDVVLLR